MVLLAQNAFIKNQLVPFFYMNPDVGPAKFRSIFSSENDNWPENPSFFHFQYWDIKAQKDLINAAKDDILWGVTLTECLPEKAWLLQKSWKISLTFKINTVLLFSCQDLNENIDTTLLSVQ